MRQRLLAKHIALPEKPRQEEIHTPQPNRNEALEAEIETLKKNVSYVIAIVSCD